MGLNINYIEGQTPLSEDEQEGLIISSITTREELDDYSRYIVHWELCSSMKADDVKRTVDTAIKKTKLVTKQKPKLLSDNGSCYIASELKTYLKDNYQMQQVHGRPNHPQTQGKIERYHITMKNVENLIITSLQKN